LKGVSGGQKIDNHQWAMANVARALLCAGWPAFFIKVIERRDQFEYDGFR